MYIKFKSKYKKIFWILLGFILSCIYVHKVYALPTTIYHNYTINDETYNIIWSQLEGKTLHEIDSSINSDLVLHRADFPYVQVYGNTGTGPNQYIYFNFLKEYHIGCPGTNVLAYPSLGEVRYFCNSNQPYFNQYWIYATIKANDNTLYGYGATNGIFTAHTQNDNRSYYKGLFNFDVYTVNHTLALAKNYEYTVETLPSYLDGYKKITLTTDDKYYMLSGLSSGSIYVPTQAFLDYGGRLSYYDKDLDSQPYTSYIQNYTNMPDDEFVRQDFDLSNYEGADWVMFSKYIYLEGEDDISYDIYVPNDIYDSEVVITPNSSGGNNFDFDYKDSNGDIQTGQVQSSDLTQQSPLLSNIFTNFTNDDFGLSSIITAPLPLIQSLGTATCTPLNLPLGGFTGRHDQTLTLPCMTPLYQNWFGDFFTLYQTITTGFIAYWVGLAFFNQIKQLKDPDYDKIEVINL